MASIPDYRLILGAEIRRSRKRARFSQRKLAEKANLHPNYMGRVERGEEYVSIKTLCRIAKALDVRVRHLVWRI